MTAVVPSEETHAPHARPDRGEPHGGRSKKGGHAWSMLTTTDHKQLGIMYLVMAFIFFGIGGLMALLIRVELFHPGLQFLS
ncbi:MAG: cytochrome ubiquinol oxidase subunit I, partial [Corynebacterium sp.]|nr:cytochrome ubiquinol oxidase subunit I [Corynebacterium sp.]